LRRRGESKGFTGRFFTGFNNLFGRVTETYVRISRIFIRRSGITLILLLLFGLLAFAFGKKIPTSFLPDEDQGYFYVNLQLPNAAFFAANRRHLSENRIDTLSDRRRAVHHDRRCRIQLIERGTKLLGGFFFVTLDPPEKNGKSWLRAIKW